INDIELNHERPPDTASEWCLKCLMLREISEIVNGSIHPVNCPPLGFSELLRPSRNVIEKLCHRVIPQFSRHRTGFRGYCLLCFQLRDYKIIQDPILNSEELRLKSDRGIRKNAQEHDMINPFRRSRYARASSLRDCLRGAMISAWRMSSKSSPA